MLKWIFLILQFNTRLFFFYKYIYKTDGFQILIVNILISRNGHECMISNIFYFQDQFKKILIFDLTLKYRVKDLDS